MLSTLLSVALVINELMASNVGEVMSPATNFDSWIEIYNTTGAEISLGGKYLSNDPDNLTLWQIPESVGSVPAKGFKVLWLGSNDLRPDQAPFKLDCDGGGIYLSNANGELIDSKMYSSAISHTAYARTTDGGDEWGWTATPTPEATNATAIFASQRLDPPKVSVGSKLFTGTLNVKVEIPEGATLMYTTDGSVPTPPRVGSSQSEPGEAPEPTWTNWVVNSDCEGEDATCFVSCNGDDGVDVNLITEGVGYNGSRGIKVHSIDNPANVWTTQFFVYTPNHVWKAGEKYRFSMRVKADNPARITVQSHNKPHGWICSNMLDNSYNITTDWQTISCERTITAEQAGSSGMNTIAFNLNELDKANNYYFDDIVWQSKYDEPIPFNITVRDNPGQKSENGEFTFTETANLCLRLFKDGYLPSVPVTRSYIQTSNQYTIPIVSIVGDEKYFTDDMWGIDVVGTNGKPGNGRDDAVNWNMDWDRPVNFSYISPEEGMLFNQDVNISVSGGWSRKDSPRSFKLKSSKVFVSQNIPNRFDYSFFPQKPYIRNKALLVRNGGNDSWSRFKDPAMTTIIQRSGIDLDVQSTVQVAEYVNGEFRGILNLRETNNDKFVYANWGYDDEEIDAFENFVFKNGTDVAWNNLLELSERVNEDGVYDEVKALLDIDEFTNYMCAELYLGNSDWPNNNVKGYRSQQDGRFRFVAFDLDQIFNYWCDMKSISTLDTQFSNEPLVRLFRNLLSNDEYRKKFIDTFCIIGGSVFESGRVTTIVDELANSMRPMMQQYDNWRTPDGSADEIKEKMQTRFDVALDQLQEYGPAQTGGLQKQSVQFNTDDTPGAHILLNGIDVPYANFKGYLFQPVRLEAVAPAGYRFAGWTSTAATSANNRLIATGDQWKYYDKGEAANGWQSADFNDAAWSDGNAPLGYNMTGVVTTVSYGSDPQRKNPTTYFRKTIQIDGTPTFNDVFKLNYQVDDGCVVYVNGKEAGRVRMNDGPVTYTTFSSTYAAGEPFVGTLDLDPSLFKQGPNVIAVEVHNTSYTSGDLFWAGELMTSVGTDNGESAEIDPVIDLPDGTVNLTARFVPMIDDIKADLNITPVRINEVSANDGIYVNDYFKREDWVELYNTTDHDIDVEGMYLSDNPEEKPKKYQITKKGTQTNTIIPAHGYLIVWCDKKDPKSQLHASFKLAAEGDELQLMAADESWADRLTYLPHKSDQTVGRFPDGSNNVYVMNYPTIGKANITSSYVTDVDQPYLPKLAGDVTGDGQVDIADVTAIIGYISSKKPAVFHASVADVDHDGLITVADLKYVTNKLLGKE